jgi:hypothetical protein
LTLYEFFFAKSSLLFLSLYFAEAFPYTMIVGEQVLFRTAVFLVAFRANSFKNGYEIALGHVVCFLIFHFSSFLTFNDY